MKGKVVIMEETKAFIKKCKSLIKDLESQDDYSNELMDKIENLYQLLSQAKEESNS